MNRKFAVAGIAAACAGALGVAGSASAGPISEDANGNYVVADLDFTPPASSTKKTASAVNLNLQASIGNNINGSPFPGPIHIEIGMPKGTVFNGESFPQCEPPKTPDDVGIESRCGKSQLIGAGTAVIDARALGVTTPLDATLTAYNQKKVNGAPTIAVFATATVNGSEIHSESDFAVKNGKITGYSLSNITGNPGLAYSYRSLDLTFGGIEKISRKKSISLFEAPVKCPRAGWKWSFLASGGDVSVTAKDAQGCVQIKD
jgi:hypothetical protein